MLVREGRVERRVGGRERRRQRAPPGMAPENPPGEQARSEDDENAGSEGGDRVHRMRTGVERLTQSREKIGPAGAQTRASGFARHAADVSDGVGGDAPSEPGGGIGEAGLADRVVDVSQDRAGAVGGQGIAPTTANSSAPARAGAAARRSGRSRCRSLRNRKTIAPIASRTVATAAWNGRTRAAAAHSATIAKSRVP